MDLRVLRNDIAKTETGRTGDAAYRTIIGHNENRLPRPITSMTLEELLAEQKRWLKAFRVASGAAGAYQIIRPTLLGLIKELNLALGDHFTPALQDRMCNALLRRRGLDKWALGQLSDDQFMVNLAKEWASFPVPFGMQGASRKILAGQSYYAGDGINKALVSIAEVRDMLRRTRETVAAEPVSVPAPQPQPRPQPRPTEQPPAPTPKSEGDGIPWGWIIFIAIVIIGGLVGLATLWRF